MPNFLKGITQIKEASKKASSGGESKFLKISDGEAVTIRFLQELDTSGKNHDESRGTAVGIYEHVNPEDFSQSFLCTKEDEGRCAGCERIPQEKKWRPRGRLLINVLVRGTGSDGSKVKVLTTSIGTRGLTPQLVDFAQEYGTLCDRDYRYKRTGEGIDTTYTILPRDASALKKDEASLELIPFEAVFRQLTYDEQVTLLGGDAGSGKGDW
jgi:hypothetical protein